MRHGARVKRRRTSVIAVATVVAFACAVFWPRIVVGARMVGMRLGTPKSVADRVEEYGSVVAERMKPAFTAAGVAWPPRSVLLVAFKEERRLELFASESGVREVTLVVPSDLRHVAGWPILAASGGAGPKLRAGDRQVPEGLYSIESLNPMSRFHLALRVAYPNDFDKAHAKEDGRDDLGGDIMVHGSNTSIGCLAMGDEVAEDLFVIAALAGVENVSILIAPCDLRMRTDAVPPGGAPAWTAELWKEIRSLLTRLPKG
jgi:hypothetical protein